MYWKTMLQQCLYSKVILLTCLLVFVFCSGCGMVSRAIVGTEDPTRKQRVLTFDENITKEGIKFYESAMDKIVEKEDKSDNKNIMKIASFVDDELARKSKAGKRSTVAQLTNMGVRVMEQPAIRKKVEEGFKFGMNALTMAISGGVGGTGIIGTLLARSRKRINYEVGKNRLKTSEINKDPAMVAAVNEAAKHTIMAGNIL